MNRVAASLLLALVFTASCAISLDRAHFIELNNKARELAQKKDWKGMRQVLLELRQELPGPTPRYLLRLASVETHLGNHESALKLLEQYAAMGLNYAVAEDDDLKPLLADRGYQKVAAHMKEASRPLAKAELVCTLPLADIMPEDITYDESQRAFVVSSVQRHTLYKVTLPEKGAQQCGLKELPLEADAKRWPILAVSADSRRKVLWMSSSAMPGFSGFPKEDNGKALLLEVDAATGKILRRFDPATGGPAVLGDMCVTPDGTVFVTDSIGGGVYRVRGKSSTAQMEKIACIFPKANRMDDCGTKQGWGCKGKGRRLSHFPLHSPCSKSILVPVGRPLIAEAEVTQSLSVR